MKLVSPQGRKCTFRVSCEQARQASLVIDLFPGVPQIFSLQRTSEGIWETELQLSPGEYRFCYHLYDGRSLQYLTPVGMKTDGLKAVLHVGLDPRSGDDNVPGDCEPLRRGVLGAELPAAPMDDVAYPAMLRRAAG